MKSVVAKYKEVDALLVSKFSGIDLKRRFPGYFNIWVFRAAWLSLLLLAITDFSLNDFALSSLRVECPHNALAPCANPFYVDHSRNMYEVSQIPAAACEKLPCDQQYLQPGEVLGRNDILARHFMLITLIIVLLAFILNHALYAVKHGTWTYKRKEPRHEIIS